MTIAPTTPAKMTGLRAGLVVALAGDAADLDVGEEPGKWRTLPALTVRAGNPWLTFEAGATRLARISLGVEAFVAQVDPTRTLAGLESLVELVIDRLPKSWRVDYVGPPLYLQLDEQSFLTASLTVSRLYNPPN